MAFSYPRFASGSSNAAMKLGVDKSFRNRSSDYVNPAYASTLALIPNNYHTLVQPAQLTGVMSITVDTTNAYVGDTIDFLFSSDSTARVVTFSTGFAPNGTLSVTGTKFASATFRFDGTNFVEVCRTVTA